MNEQPGEPRGKSAEVHEVQIGDGFVSSNRGHAAPVPIPEALRLATFNHRQNVARRVAALLHRNRRYTRQGLTGLMEKVREITDHLYLRMARNGEIVVD